MLTHAEALLQESYYQPGEDWDNLKKRVARTVAGEDKGKYEKYLWLLDYFTPNTPCLMNAGTRLNQLMACFVLPIPDSIEGIGKSLSDMMIIQKSGGGTGFVASKLRPQGDTVSSTGGMSSGPLSFLSIYNHAIGEIKQGGKRRGASLAAIRCDHPDILNFIQEKRNPERMTNFNLSVGITDDFMVAVANNDYWSLINPRNGEEINAIPAREIWGAIVECAWATGEPGILFLDRINRDNPTPQLGEIEATNPCGEAALLPYEACVLGSINIHKVLSSRMDWELLRRVARVGVEFLDDVIEASKYPIPEIECITKRNRKIGLGISGWASLLYEWGIPYYSQDARRWAEDVWSFVNEEAVKQTHLLGQELGGYMNDPNRHNAKIIPRRNASVTSIAPEGSRALINDITSGIEPAYALVYRRLILGKEWRIVDKVFERWLRERGIYSESLIDEVEANRGSCQGMPGVPEDMQRVFVTAHDIDPADHVRMQASFQKYTEMSISKTINMPHDASLEEVYDVLLYAHEQDCKGITVYRDGSRVGQILTTKHTPTERPHILYGKTQKFETNCGSLYVTMNNDEAGDPHEVFANHAIRSGCVTSLLNALASVTSVSLRAGVDPQVLAKPLSRQECGQCNGISSCADAIGQTLVEKPSSCTIGGECQTCG